MLPAHLAHTKLTFALVSSTSINSIGASGSHYQKLRNQFPAKNPHAMNSSAAVHEGEHKENKEKESTAMLQNTSGTNAAWPGTPVLDGVSQLNGLLALATAAEAAAAAAAAVA